MPVLVFSLVAHEYAHGYAALQQGDDTAYMLGRLTFNPLPHIDPWMSILMPALLFFVAGPGFVFGGAKPIPVVTRKFRNYRRGDLIVSSAGVATNLVLAGCFTLAFAAIGLVGQALPDLTTGLGVVQRMTVWGIQINLLLCVFNLIPIPPLDGSKILYHFLPPGLGAQYRSLERYGFLILLLMLYLLRPLFALLLTPATWMLDVLLNLVVPHFALGDSWNIFTR
ncbi:MAG: site-2 protease family protein [Gemmatimonadota bacterium]